MKFRSNLRTRAVAGAIGGLAITGGFLSTTAYAAPGEVESATAVTAVEEGDFVTVKTLSSDAVATILSAAQETAEEEGVRVTVAVVDRAGERSGC